MRKSTMRLLRILRNLFRQPAPMQIHHLPRPMRRRRRDPELPADVSCMSRIRPVEWKRGKAA